MKNLKRTLLATITILFLGMGNVSAQEKEAQTVILSVFDEVKGSEMHLTLMVLDPDGIDYEVSLQSRNAKNRKEVFVSNAKIIQSEINKWKQKGFKIDVFMNIDNGEYIIMSKE